MSSAVATKAPLEAVIKDEYKKKQEELDRRERELEERRAAHERELLAKAHSERELLRMQQERESASPDAEMRRLRQVALEQVQVAPRA